MWGVWPVFSLPERALYQMNRLDALEKSSNGTFHLIKSKQDLINYEEARKLNNKMTAGYLTIKGTKSNMDRTSNPWDDVRINYFRRSSCYWKDFSKYR